MKLFEREQESEPAEMAAQAAPEEDQAAETDPTRDDEMSREKDTQRSSFQNASGAPQAADGQSVIGRSLFVRGEVEAAEDMLIEGRVEGSIRHTASCLTIGVSGVVNADIDARNLVIEGTVEGNVVGSESVVIRASADVRGNVYTARISIADGARFSGTVDMDQSKSPRH